MGPMATQLTLLLNRVLACRSMWPAVCHAAVPFGVPIWLVYCLYSRGVRYSVSMDKVVRPLSIDYFCTCTRVVQLAPL